MKSALSEINTRLNALKIYRDKKCINCGRSYPDTVINIEENIHHNHGKDYRCVDVKSCNKAKKKIRK